MRPGPATPVASHVDSCSAFVTAGRRNDRLSPTALQKERHICQGQLPILRSRDHKPATAAVASSPLRFKESEWEEAAMPGQPVRARARFGMSPGDSPSRIAGCRWLCRNHSAGPGTPTFSLVYTLPLDPGGLQVENGPRLCRNCGRSDFAVEDRGKQVGNCPARAAPGTENTLLTSPTSSASRSAAPGRSAADTSPPGCNDRPSRQPGTSSR